MTDELAELAASAATALVTAMGTDLWQEAKKLMGGILAHGGVRRREELTAALDRPSPAAAANVRRGADEAGSVNYWTEALAQLLDQNPDLVQHVRALAALRGRERSGPMIQINSATHSGEVFAVQQGVQHIDSSTKTRDAEERP